MLKPILRTRRPRLWGMTAVLAAALTAPLAAAPGRRAADAPLTRPAGPPPRVLLAEAMKGPLAGVRHIVFGVTEKFDRMWTPVTNHHREPANHKGAQLCKLDLHTGQVTLLLDDPKGHVRDLQVHYDGRKAIFAYRKGGAPGTQLYEINLDGTGLTRITPEDRESDISPTYLPNDDIIFASTRSRRYVACAGSYTTTLFRCRGDGSRLFPISSSLEHERGAGVLADGRIIFHHWDYYHRGTHFFMSLFTSNPDGTGLMAAYGNMHANYKQHWWADWPRQMPGGDRIVLVDRADASAGPVAVIDLSKGPDDPHGIRHVPGSPKECFDPCPLGGDWVLTATADSLVLLDGKGGSETIFTAGAPCRVGKDFWLVSPNPVRPRPREPVIPDRVDLGAATGKFLLADVHAGRNMAGVKPGEVKQLLVLEWLPTPFVCLPTARAAFFLHRILGTVPVESDGSASFEAPAGRAYAFVPLDARGLSIKHMQSAAHLMPGEVAACVGCHEPRTQALSPGRSVAAAARPPSRIQPYDGIPERLDYREDLQPIWDRHCVKCHNPDQREGGVLMTADRGGGVTSQTLGLPHSRLSLMAAGQVVDCRGPNQWGNLPPRRMGSGASPLMKKLDGSHHGVKVSAREWTTVALWLDTMIPLSRYYGEQEYAWLYKNSKTALRPSAAAMAVIERRCFGCHEKRPPHKDRMGGSIMPGYRAGEEGRNYLFYPEPGPSPENDQIHPKKDRSAMIPEYDAYWREAFSRNESQLRRGSAIIVNWDRPEKSLVLLAPLAKSAGGYATASEADVKAGKVKACPVLFRGTDDPDYQAILAGLPRVPAPKAESRMRMHHSFKEFGVVPPGPPDHLGQFDKEALWQAYWQSLRWRPVADGPR